MHVDEKAFPIDVLPVGRTLYSILLDGRSYEVDCIEVDDALMVLVDGQPFRVVLQDEAAPLVAELTTSRRTPTSGSVTAPMPGKVVRVHVAVGERVAAGAPVCALEAMKMENELTAPTDARVTAVHVAVGETVRAGQILIEMDPAGAEAPGNDDNGHQPDTIAR